MSRLTLASVQRDFKAWRASKTKKTKIPEALWNKTLKLLDHYPISKVVRDLRFRVSRTSLNVLGHPSQPKRIRRRDDYIYAAGVPVRKLQLHSNFLLR